MALQKIEGKTLRQMVYDQLKGKIISAEMPPGEQIRLRSLAEELGVSLMPVREALWQLESENVIVIESNKSMHVNNLTPKQMEEVLRIRLNLESMAAEEACKLRPGSALAPLEHLVTEMYSSLEDPARYLEGNRSFHFALYKLAESPMLMRMIGLLWARVGPYSYLYTPLKHLSVAMKYHEAILGALMKRDKKAIAGALRADLQAAADLIKPFLVEEGKDHANKTPFAADRGIV